MLMILDGAFQFPTGPKGHMPLRLPRHLFPTTVIYFCLIIF